MLILIISHILLFFKNKHATIKSTKIAKKKKDKKLGELIEKNLECRTNTSKGLLAKNVSHIKIYEK